MHVQYLHISPLNNLQLKLVTTAQTLGAHLDHLLSHEIEAGSCLMGIAYCC